MTTLNRRNHALDVLRGIAALGVVFFHFGGKDAPFSFTFGKHGVELFFLISGYVILMSAERKPSPRAFASARFWRLYPTFWLSIAYTLGVLAVLGTAMPANPLIQIPFNMLMFPKFFGVDYIDGVYWTLEYELIFYAYVVGLMILGRLSWCAWVLTGVSMITSIAFFTGLRALTLEYSPGAAPVVFRVLFLMLDGKAHLFLLGILAYLAKSGRFRCSHWTAVFVCIAGIGADERASYVNMAVVCGIFALAVWSPSRVNIPRALLWLGAISYPLYLIHMRAGKAMLSWFDARGIAWWWGFGTALVLSLVAAEGIRRLSSFEKWKGIKRTPSQDTA